MSDLKKCPCCGSEAELYSDGGVDMVVCTVCDLSVRGIPISDTEFNDSLIEKWNTRNPDTEALKSEIEEHLSFATENYRNTSVSMRLLQKTLEVLNNG